jgi:hypothetical protein
MGSCNTKLHLSDDLNLELSNDGVRKLLTLNLHYAFYDKDGKRKIDELTSKFLYSNIQPANASNEEEKTSNEAASNQGQGASL